MNNKQLEDYILKNIEPEILSMGFKKANWGFSYYLELAPKISSYIDFAMEYETNSAPESFPGRLFISLRVWNFKDHKSKYLFQGKTRSIHHNLGEELTEEDVTELFNNLKEFLLEAE
jgi:hypothetical protein